MAALPTTTTPAAREGDKSIAAVTTVTTFGRVVSAEFIGALVQGLPELPCGTPALELFADVLQRGADAVPHEYGDLLGTKVYQRTRRTFWEHDLVEEAMLTFITTAVRGRVYLGAGWPLPNAERYVLRAVANAAKNTLRSRWRSRRGEVPLDPKRDLDEQRAQYVDPRSIDLEDRIVATLDLRTALSVQKVGHRRFGRRPPLAPTSAPPKTSSNSRRP